MTIRQFAITVVIIETICIVIMLALLVIPREAIDVMGGKYKLVRIEE